VEKFLTSQIYWDTCGLESPYSGIGSYARSLYCGLVEKGVSPRLLGKSGVASSGQEGRAYPFKKIIQPHKGYLQLVTKNIFIKQEAKTILHAHANCNLPVLFRKPNNVYYVLSVHDTIALLDPSVVSRSYYLQFDFLLRRSLLLADQIICVSEWTYQQLLKINPNIVHKAQVIPHGAVRRATVRTSPNRQARGGINLLYVSRFEIYKRFKIVVEILEKMPEVFFTVVSNSKGMDFFQEVGKKFLASGRLKVKIAVSSIELKKLYQKADLYCHPSLYEGYCLPVQEALDAGLTVVFTKGSAMDELVTDGLGFGVPAEHGVNSWKKKILEALSLKETGLFYKAQKQRSQTLLTWQQVASSYLRVYNKI
jgi:glycosyltransferase involved in cell wall biosynthesis